MNRKQQLKSIRSILEANKNAQERSLLKKISSFFLVLIVAVSTLNSLVMPAISMNEETAEEEPGIEIAESTPEPTPEAASEPVPEAAPETTPEVIAEEEPVEEVVPNTTEEQTETVVEKTNEETENKEKQESLPAVKAGEKTVTCQNATEITVKYTEQAGLYDSAELLIEEITEGKEYQALVKKAEEEVEEEITSVRFFNVHTSENEDVKGKTVVTVSMEKRENVQVLVLNSTGNYEVTDTDVKENLLSFETEDLKQFAIVFTAEEKTEKTAVYEKTLSSKTTGLSVSVVITDTVPIPEDVKLVVTPLTSTMKDYSAYMEALNKGFEKDTYNSDNTLLYDVTVYTNDKKYEPTDGTVDVTMQFTKKQLSEELGVNESSLQIIHLPAVEEHETLTASEIEREFIEDTTVDMSGKTEEVSFTLNSLSVITVTGATTNVTVNASLLGTDMKTLNYNLYAYLLASNDNTAYGAKITFENGNAEGVIANVPPNTYKLYLVYARDNREMNTRWNYNNVLDANTNNWVDTDGSYIFGYAAKLPADKTITMTDNTVSFTLEVPAAQSTFNVNSLMDRAINYGITAENVNLPNNCYTNFAAKNLDIQNQNSQTYYGHRSDGIDVVPNIAANVNNNGQPLTTENNQAANYYVTDTDKNKVNSTNQEETIVRNKHEIEDRVEILINNTLKQCDDLKTKSVLTLPKGTEMDVTPYGDNATIILDATAISGEQNGYTIIKRPGQTIVFNINGQNAAPPENIKVKLVNKDGQQVDVSGNPSSKIYIAGDDMRNAPAAEGNVWNKIIWNFPDVTGTVQASNQIGGIFLVPHGSFQANNKGGGWIIARHNVKVTNEWYAFPGTDEPFKQKIIRKTFVGLNEEEINSDYAVKVWTHVNESTSGTTHEELITTLVLKDSNDASLVKNPNGTNDQTGYLTKGTDADGNVVIEWKTPPLSVGNEHLLTEINTTSTNSEKHLDLVTFEGPYSAWNAASENYEWTSREASFASEEEFRGVFNISTHNDDYRQYAYITNWYNIDKNPHSLSLTKRVVDEEGLSSEETEYTFEISFQSEEELSSVQYRINNGEEESETLTDGKVIVNLKNNDAVTFTNLPYGTAYTLEETSIPENCEVTYEGDSVTGRLIQDRTVTAVNTFSDDPGVPITAHKDLIDGVLQDGQFTFKLVDENNHVVKTAVNDANGNISFGTLSFPADGDYTYRMFEAVNPQMKDIIFDSSVYTVQIKVTGGKVREVTYSGNVETPMFRNRKIETDSDTLKARKIFMDENDKAVELEGGEFTFKAESTDETPIVYTGTNDSNGMVTFKDADGQEVDLNNLTQPTTFIISEMESQYEGELTQEIEYDTNKYSATAHVETKSVTVNPWSQEVTDANTTNLTVTFTPKDTSGTTYYLKPQYDPAYSELRSDGTVTFTIPVSKNLVSRDNVIREYTFQYGKGNNYYYGAQEVGTVTIRAKAGDWGKENVMITSVSVDGTTLSSSAKTEKTVTLQYKDGSYPVFVNRIKKEETTSFTFFKVWTNNVTYSNPEEWTNGTAIDVTLSGSDGSEYAYTIQKTETGFTFNKTEDAPEMKALETGKTNDYGFVIENLSDASYTLKESELSGYAVHYGTWDTDKNKAVVNAEIAATGITNEGCLINARITAELPHAGGSGTRMFYIFGTILVLGAGILLVGRRTTRA